MKRPFLQRDFQIKWSKLTPEHIESDIQLALDNAQKDLKTLTQQDLTTLTYDSVMGAQRRALEPLSRAWGLLNHLSSVADNADQRKAYNLMLPKVSDFYSSLYMNAALWTVVRTYSESEEAKTLTPVLKRHVEESVKSFEENGANLDNDNKETLAVLNRRLSAATQKYSENVLDAINAYELIIDDESRLKGLPDSAKSAAQASAEKKGHGDKDAPKWRFTLQRPSLTPVLKHATDDNLRKTLWLASRKVGRQEPNNNIPLVREILNLREQKAKLLGHKNFPDMVLSRRMAQNGNRAFSFIKSLHSKIEVPFAKSIAEIESHRSDKLGLPKTEKMEPWDITYWKESLKMAKHNFDDEVVRPYFSMATAMQGVFDIAKTLFGIDIIELKTDVGGENGVDVWHQDVKFFEIHDHGRHLGSFYADFHPREGKRGGAWMNALITGEPSDNGLSPHLGLICGNMTPPIGDAPALLTHREVQTIFHEFGHLIHHLLGEVEAPELNGTRVAWDFVELPSQIMENWCWEPEALTQFAKHYETGESIPEDILNKMNKARNFQSAIPFMRQLAFGMLDFTLHLESDEWAEDEIETNLRKALRSYRPQFASEEPTYMSQFSHLFASPVGYASGYYSYKWAEVLDADAFSKFKQDGIFNPETGRAFREAILSKGNSAPPDELFRNFMGRGPDPEALLRRDGLL